MATIEGEEGFFYGSFSLTTDQPDGYGIFVCGEIGNAFWVHCGKVQNGVFTGSRKVSGNDGD